MPLDLSFDICRSFSLFLNLYKLYQSFDIYGKVSLEEGSILEFGQKRRAVSRIRAEIAEFSRDRLFGVSVKSYADYGSRGIDRTVFDV